METATEPVQSSSCHRKDAPAPPTSVESCARKRKRPGGRAKNQIVRNIDMQDVDGVWLMTFNATDDMPGFLSQLRSLDMRGDDVITCGFPRSGNHWCFELVNMVLSQTTDFKAEYFATNLLDIPGCLEKIPAPRNLVTHLRPRHFPTQVLEKQVKIIYLLRNPKDVLVSMFHMNSQFYFDNWRFCGSWEQFLDLHLSGDLPNGRWWDHVNAVENFAAAHPEIPVHIFQFEKVKERPVEEIRKLCTFLGYPCDLAEQIAHVTRFENMKAVLGDRSAGKIAAMEKVAFQGRDVVLRKGQVGDWSNWFTPEQSDRFHAEFEENTRTSKWARLVRPYMGLPDVS